MQNIRKYIIAFSIFLNVISLCAQNSYDDSIINSLQNIPDSQKILKLNELCWSLKTSDPIAAIKYGKLGLEQSERSKFYIGKAQALNYLGVVYMKLADYSTASRYFFSALTFSDSLHFLMEKGYALNNISSLLFLQNDWQQSLYYSQRSLDLQISIKNKKGIAYAYLRMSEAYNGLQQYDSLLLVAKKAYQIRKELGNEEGYLVALRYIGMAYQGKKQYKKALECYFQIINSKLNLTIAFENAAEVYLKLYKPELAIVYAQKALKYKPNDYELHVLLADAYAMNGHWSQAFYTNRKAVKIQDSIAVVDKFRQTKNLQIIYETQEKDKENNNLRFKIKQNRTLLIGFSAIILLVLLIAIILFRKRKQLMLLNTILNQKNEEIMIQRDLLNEVNRTKDKFMSIIAHDLRGPIGSTNSFLEFLTSNWEKYTSEQLSKNLSMLQESIGGTYKLLENLLTWARAQQGDIRYEPNYHDLNKIIYANIELFFSSCENKKIVIQNEISEPLVLFFDFDMINTVVRNLLNNAIKYSFENSIIHISANRLDNMVKICISDNGIGIDENILTNLFGIDVKHHSIQGTNGEKGTGLGLILCKEFIEKNNGTIWVKSQVNVGSQFYFTLQVNSEIENVKA